MRVTRHLQNNWKHFSTKTFNTRRLLSFSTSVCLVIHLDKLWVSRWTTTAYSTLAYNAAWTSKTKTTNLHPWRRRLGLETEHKDLVHSSDALACSSNITHQSTCLLILTTGRAGSQRNVVTGMTPCSFRVRTDIKMLFFQDFPGLAKTKFQGFPGLKNPFSRTFQDMFHSQTWIAWGKKSAYTKSVISVPAWQ